MSKKIVIDPGHGGSDSGAVGFGLLEKNINLDIALQLRDRLANYADIIMTRSGDVSVSLSERAAAANRADADFFISVHVNAGGGTGFESYVYTGAGTENERLRKVIHQAAAEYYKSSGFPDRGMKRANFAVLRETLMPSVLLENLFIDRQEDAAKLKDPAFRKGIAGAVAAGVINALELSPQPGPQPAPAPQPQPQPQPEHWAAPDFQRIRDAGLVNSDHNLDTPVTWGEMSAVIARLLDKLKM